MRKIDLIFVLIMAIMAILLLRSCDQQKSAKSLYEATQDTLSVRTNELGQQIASINALRASSAKDLLTLKTKDSTIIRLQGVVKDYKGRISSATVISTESSDVGTTATIVSFPDSAESETQTPLYPTYESVWDEQWSMGYIIANKDSISRKIRVKNEFDITVGWANKGLFKKKEFEVSVLNKNPNTVTTELQTFKVEVPKKRFSLGVQAGYGVLIDKSGLSTGVYLGGGVSWTILRF